MPSINRRASITNLVPDQPYYVFIQYASGAKRTTCKRIYPIENRSLTELNGGDFAVEGDPRCFIVSAAYGSHWAPDVNLFRWARDKFILPTPFGQTLMDFYYENSQPYAQAIKESKTLQTIVRGLLWAPALVLYALQFIVNQPLLFLFYSFSLSLIFLALFTLYRRFKGNVIS